MCKKNNPGKFARKTGKFPGKFARNLDQLLAPEISKYWVKERCFTGVIYIYI